MRFGWMAVAAACVITMPSSAAVIYGTADITASGLRSGDAMPGPVDPVQLTLSFKYDNTTEGQGGRVFVLGSNIPITKQVRVYYDVGQDILTFGTNARSGGFALTAAENDLGFSVFNASTNPNTNLFGYSDGAGLIYFASSVRFEVTSDFYPAVPEPASWALMIGGFALVGAAQRRSRHRVARFAAQ